MKKILTNDEFNLTCQHCKSKIKYGQDFMKLIFKNLKN